jgi:hypothetical protein
VYTKKKHAHRCKREGRKIEERGKENRGGRKEIERGGRERKRKKSNGHFPPPASSFFFPPSLVPSLLARTSFTYNAH